MAIERNNSFHLMLSDDELALLKLLAEREGLNASDYLRSLLRQMAGASSHVTHIMRLGAALDLKKIAERYAGGRRADSTPSLGSYLAGEGTKKARKR